MSDIQTPPGFTVTESQPAPMQVQPVVAPQPEQAQAAPAPQEQQNPQVQVATPQVTTQASTVQPQQAPMTVAASAPAPQPVQQMQQPVQQMQPVPQVQQPVPQVQQPVQQMQQPIPQVQQPVQPLMQPAQPMMQPVGNVPMVMGQQPMVGVPAVAAPPRINMSSLETTLDDKSLIGLEQFGKLNNGQAAVITPLLFNEDGGVRILHFHNFFLQELKKSFLAPTHDGELMRIATDEFGPPKSTAMLLVYHYNVNEQGMCYPQMDKNGQMKTDPESGQVIPDGKIVLFRPSREKIPPIKQIGATFGLQRSDIFMRCAEQTYQRYDIQAMPQRFLNNAPAYLRSVTERALSLWDNEVAKMIPAQVDKAKLLGLVNEWRAHKAGASGGAPVYGAPGGPAVNPFATAAAGQPSGAVGMGGMVSTSPMYVTQQQPVMGVPAESFGDMIAAASQQVKVG